MKDLTKGKPSRLILAFALPIFLANLLQLTYSLVDTRIVGTFLGEDALAAVGATSSLSNLIIGFLMGLSNGFAIITAQRFGAKDHNDLLIADSPACRPFHIKRCSLSICRIKIAGMFSSTHRIRPPLSLFFRFISDPRFHILVFANTIIVIYNTFSSFSENTYPVSPSPSVLSKPPASRPGHTQNGPEVF